MVITALIERINLNCFITTNLFLVFFYYYIWGFLVYVVFFYRNIIEYSYIKYNQTSTIFKRDFNELSYFEKLFLVLFYRKNIFSNSIANIYTNSNLIDFRKNKYPLIFFFHFYFDKSDYKIPNITFLIKQYLFFYKSSFFKKALDSIRKRFFKNLHVHTLIVYLIVQKFFFKRYYNLCSSLYFENYKPNNFVKFNFLFLIYLNNSNKYFYIYDLSKYNNWYDYVFKKCNQKSINKGKKKKLNQNIKNKKYLMKIYKNYNSFFKVFYKNFNLNVLLLNNNIFKKIKFNRIWNEKLQLFYPVRFSETSISKHINLDNINNYLFFFIRKNRIFNKGRYSRNRQLYRTGVYWCLWLNIMLVYGLYFLFYRFTFNFGYFWWGLLILMYSTIFSRVIKYNFHNFYYLKDEFVSLVRWFGLIIINLKYLVVNFLIGFIQNNYIYDLITHSFLIKFFNNFVLNLSIKLYSLFAYKNTGRFIYFWENMNEKDESFFKHKSILHWFTQMYKLLTY